MTRPGPADPSPPELRRSPGPRRVSCAIVFRVPQDSEGDDDSAATATGGDVVNLPRRPEIEYPTTWGYHVIGADEARLRDAVARVLGDRDYTFSLSNQSSRGKYLSFHVELVVRDEEERIELFAALRDHPDIVIVL